MHPTHDQLRPTSPRLRSSVTVQYAPPPPIAPPLLFAQPRMHGTQPHTTIVNCRRMPRAYACSSLVLTGPYRNSYCMPARSRPNHTMHPHFAVVCARPYAPASLHSTHNQLHATSTAVAPRSAPRACHTRRCTPYPCMHSPPTHQQRPRPPCTGTPASTSCCRLCRSNGCSHLLLPRLSPLASSPAFRGSQYCNIRNTDQRVCASIPAGATPRAPPSPRVAFLQPLLKTPGRRSLPLSLPSLSLPRSLPLFPFFRSPES